MAVGKAVGLGVALGIVRGIDVGCVVGFGSRVATARPGVESGLAAGVGGTVVCAGDDTRSAVAIGAPGPVPEGLIWVAGASSWLQAARKKTAITKAGSQNRRKRITVLSDDCASQAMSYERIKDPRPRSRVFYSVIRLGIWRYFLPPLPLDCPFPLSCPPLPGCVTSPWPRTPSIICWAEDRRTSASSSLIFLPV